jgi:tripartite-type tricarboxylate transporter receptor subunit TctC
MKLIPFKDSASVVIGMLRNDVQIGVETLPGSLAHIQEGKLKLLAVADKRLSIVPDVPTMTELGLKPLPGQWIAAYVSSKTPPAVVQKLTDAFGKSLTAPGVKEQFDKMVFGVVATGGAETAKKLKEENDAWCAASFRWHWVDSAPCAWRSTTKPFVGFRPRHHRRPFA